MNDLINVLERQLNEQAHLLDDPLAVHESLIAAYVEQGQTSGLIKALERCTQQFVQDRRYRNDIRYLRVWLQYARHCRSPLEIFEFLDSQCIGKELALLYEEWAKVLSTRGQVDQGRSILKKGIEAQAQPLERLKKTFVEYAPSFTNKRSSWENSNGQSISWTLNNNTSSSITTTGKKETRYYDPEIIEHGRITFEQARAKYYRQQKALKTKATTIANTNLADGEDDDEEVPGLSQPINPDELTHISVYKDNTADVRELSRLAKSAMANNSALEEFIKENMSKLKVESSDVSILPRISAIKMTSGSGDGRTQTISAIKTVLGHFFLESKLGEGEFVAVDVGNSDIETESAKQVLQVIKLEDERSGLYEAIMLNNLGISVRLARYADCLLMVRTHYQGGTIQALLQRKYKFEPILSLFFARELMQAVSNLHSQNIFHGDIRSETVHLTFALPKGGGVALTGHRPLALTKGVSSAREADLNGLQGVCAALYQSSVGREESVEWRELIGHFQKKRDLGSIVESVNGMIANYQKRPSLRSLLISLETDIISQQQ